MNEKEWTIMIYMAGDNNLAVDMAYAMEQIKEVAAEGTQSPNLLRLLRRQLTRNSDPVL